MTVCSRLVKHSATWMSVFVNVFLGDADAINISDDETSITRPNCALDRCTILCLYVPGFHRKVFKHVEILSERSKGMKEQKKNKGSVLNIIINFFQTISSYKVIYKNL